MLAGGSGANGSSKKAGKKTGKFKKKFDQHNSKFFNKKDKKPKKDG